MKKGIFSWKDCEIIYCIHWQTAAHDVTGLDGCMYLSQPIYLQCDSRQPIPVYSLDYNYTAIDD